MNKEKQLDKYMVYLTSKHRKKKTRTGYHHPIKQFLRQLDKKIDDISQEDITRWMAYQNTQGYKHNGITLRVIAVNKYLTWINKPELKIPLPRWQPVNRKTIRLPDIQQLLQTAKNNPKDLLILRFITDLDARPDSIINSKLSSLTEEKIYFNDTKTGDNYGFITPGFQDALTQYKDEIRPTPQCGHEDYILLTTNGQRYRSTYIIRQTIADIAMKAEIPPILPYDLRASVITEEFNHYINPKVIQRKARHKRPETTQKYNHVTDEMVRDYVHYDLIFDKPCLYQKNKEKLDTKLYLEPSVLTKGFNKTLENEDTNMVSFSINSFSTSLMQGVAG